MANYHIFLAFAIYAACVSGLPNLSIIKHCCELGTNFAESGLKCNSFQTPIAGISSQDESYCLNRVKVCCQKKFVEKQCNFGKSVASSGGSCTSPTLDNEYSQSCCETCQLGLDASKANENCDMSLELGPPYDETYTQCCKEDTMFSTTTTTRRSTTSRSTTKATTLASTEPTNLSTLGGTTPSVLVEVCDMCAQLCHPYEGSNRCDCYPGYTIMKDGISCKPNKKPTKCPKNNPCEHDCYDTGTMIQCTCRSGYKLGEDKKSCEDIDECATGTHDCESDEKCVNYEGDYECDPINDVDPINEVDSTEFKTCPLGYKFYGEESLCKDIDECEFALSCQRPKVCVNTVGSYLCKGDDLPPCPPGFFYKEAILDCADIDECITGDNDCNRESQTCLNTKGNYTCIDKTSTSTCPPGFKKNTATDNCEDINECIESPELCGEDQECINEPGGHSCLPKLPLPTHKQAATETTKETTSPETSTTPTTTATSLPPLVFLPPSTTTTLPLYTPPTAFAKYTPTIQETTAKETPKTPPPYQTPVVVNSPYNPFSARYPTNLQPVSCSRGYKYSNLYADCIDIDECVDEEPCDSNQECYNKPGSYVCNCKEGFTKDFQTGACIDVNECQLRTHDCLDGQRCDNTIGSYLCSRTAGCGTGYTLNYANNMCEDDDECTLGTHSCNDLGSKFQCRNTLGSYRCDLKPVNTFKPLTTPTTHTPQVINGQQLKCLPGYYMDTIGRCKDIDECESSPCPRGQKCLNLNGRYECIPAMTCRSGFELNEAGDSCIDINECTRGTHKCGPSQICKNAPGFYMCECPPGHQLDYKNECVDINECQHYRGRICSANGECVNSIGSYKCMCKKGFRGNGTYCEDIDECQETPNMCQQVCVNLYGSYRCSCQRGFTLNADNRTCKDIDECEKFKDRALCVGQCNNVPGSYACSCPEGYRVGSDGRTCQDNDECLNNPCKGPDEICFNMRGTYRCPSIRCPPGYVKDRDHKSRCTKANQQCDMRDSNCLQQPRFYSFHFVTLVSKYIITKQVDFFHMKGPTNAETQIEYQLVLKSVRCPPQVRPVDDSYFTRTIDRKNILLSIVKSIEGPQDIELQLHATFYVNGAFHAKALSRIFVYVSAFPF